MGSHMTETGPVIFHIDVNSAFLSWTAAENLRTGKGGTDLRDIPSVVGGDEKKRHGVVLAKSTPAGKCGIRTGESLMEARSKCPGLTIVPPDFDLYVRSSRALIDLLLSYTDRVMQYSIDEAFADMTGYPFPDSSPLILAETLRKKIFRELGFTVNIGISANMFLAKTASDFEKPDKVHTLFPSEIEKKLWPLPVREMLFVGRSGEKNLNGLGIHTIGDLAKTDRSILLSHFGKYGGMIWDFAHGEDHSTAFSFSEETKVYGNAVTVASDIVNSADASSVLLSLCETVGARLRADKMLAGVLAVSIVYSDFSRASHQKKLSSPTDATTELYASSVQLFQELWSFKPVRQLGVHTSDVAHEAVHQYSLFETDHYERLSKLDSAIDAIREKYGEDSVIRARFLKHPEDQIGGIGRAGRKNASVKKENKQEKK
jgi:DNA polymerase-4